MVRGLCVRRVAYLSAMIAFLAGWALPFLALSNTRPVRVELLHLLHQEKFGELESRLSKNLADYRAGKISDRIAEKAFFAFASADPNLEPKLARWIKDWPTSASPRLARAQFNVNLAWIYRSYALAKDVSDSRFAMMHRYLAEASRDLTAALELDPSLGIAYGTFIRIAMMQGRTGSADALIDVALRADPRSFVVRARYLYSLVPWWRGSGDPSSFSESIAQISKFLAVIEHDAQDNSALLPLVRFDYYVAGELFARRNQRKKAIPFYESALKSGDYWWYLQEQGYNYYRLKQYDKAIVSFTRALKASPMVPDTLDWRGRSFKRSGQLEQAIADFKTALSVDPRNPRILVQLAYGLREGKRYDEVLSTLDLAMLYGTDDEDVRDARGRILLYELNQPAEAVADLRRTTELDPARTRYWYNYGLALYRAKSCEAGGAFETYRTVCAEKSDCSAAQLKSAAEVIRYQKHPRICPTQSAK